MSYYTDSVFSMLVLHKVSGVGLLLSGQGLLAMNQRAEWTD